MTLEVATVVRIEGNKAWVRIPRFVDKHTYGPCPILESVALPPPPIKKKTAEAQGLDLYPWFPDAYPVHLWHTHSLHQHEFEPLLRPLAPGDEVIVGFEGGSHQRPIIIGRTWKGTT